MRKDLIFISADTRVRHIHLSLELSSPAHYYFLTQAIQKKHQEGTPAKQELLVLETGETTRRKK